MATIREEFNALKLKIAAGKENEIVHVVYVDQDRKRKLVNSTKGDKKAQTRFSLETGSPEMFRDLFAEWDRILLQVKNKTMAIDIIIWWLRLLTKERIEKKIKAGADAGPQPAAIPAEDWIEGREEPGLEEIPEWLRE
jgi:hypothetical protein